MYKFLLLLLLLLNSFLGFSQCTSTISSFPYNESFENSTGGWISGGILSDWAWGSPNKAYITTAGSGLKCWITGGLNGSSYNSCERSWVESPCFDFTALTKPHVKFNIYWESEKNYDGATFQYSLNNGTTWINVGAFNDPIDCLNQNWFNNNNITHLGVSSGCNPALTSTKHGWAGSVATFPSPCTSNSGSAGWVVAQHCMSNLAGVANVKFRFAFGAGSTCNNFDGIAFDNITIGEAPANNANFTFGCTPTSLQYQFTNTSTLCPSGFSWNFGDPTSGTNNTSIVTNPMHQFSAPGTYTVTLSVNGPCNAPSTITKTVVTVSNTISSVNAWCFGTSTGSITSTLSNGNGVITYTLLPSNTTNNNGLFTNLLAGNYTVNVIDAAGCGISSTTTIGGANAINVSTSNIQPICNGFANGSINVTATGGAGGFAYVLNPGNVNNNSGIFANLSAGIYTIISTDANSCTTVNTITLGQPNPLTITNFTLQDIICAGSNAGIVTINVSGGTGTINYSLNGSTNTNTIGFFGNLSSGNYTVTAIDAQGCTVSSAFTVAAPNPIIINNILVKQPGCTPNNDGEIIINAAGGNGQLNYSINGTNYSTTPNFNSLTSNIYTITVKDSKGCTATSTTELISNNAPSFIATTTTDIKCFNSNDGEIIALATNGSIPISNYSLSPGGITNSTGIFSNLTAGNYTVTVVDNNACSNVTTLTINAPNELKFVSVNSIADECGSSNNAKIIASTSGGTNLITYYLEPTNTQNYSGIFSGLEYGNYTITAKDLNDCTNSTTISIFEKICCENVFVPTAFSPNNDGRNDELNLLNKNGIILDQFIIVNRWGNIVFTAQHIDDRWDGKYKSIDAELGTYYYLLKYKCSSTDKNYFYKGDILLVR
jgi:gliding motility-associated-like protein